MKTQENYNERFNRCADIVFQQSDAHFGVDHRSSVSLKTLAYTAAAPTLLQANGFKQWLDYPSLNTVPDWIADSMGEQTIAFLEQKGVFTRNASNELVLSDSFSKSNMLHSTLNCNLVVKTAAMEMVGVLLKIQRGQLEGADLPFIADTKVQAAAFAGGLSHFESTLSCIESIQEVCEKIVTQGTDQAGFYAAHQSDFENTLDAFFQLEAQCSAPDDGSQLRMIELLSPGHGKEAVNSMMASAAGQIGLLLQQINENGFVEQFSHRG